MVTSYIFWFTSGHNPYLYRRPLLLTPYILPVCVQSHWGWWPVSWCWRTDAGRQWQDWDLSSQQRADGATFQHAAGEAASDWDQSSGPHTLTWRGSALGTGHHHPTWSPHRTKRKKLSIGTQYFVGIRQNKYICSIEICKVLKAECVILFT